MIIHNICFHWDIRKLFTWYTFSSRPMRLIRVFSVCKGIWMIVYLSFHSRPRGFKTFFMLNSAEHEIYFAYKPYSCSTQLSMLSWFEHEKSFNSWYFYFMTKWNFILSWVKHKNSFITSGPDLMKWTLPSLNFDTTFVANGGFSKKSITEWQTVKIQVRWHIMSFLSGSLCWGFTAQSTQ